MEDVAVEGSDFGVREVQKHKKGTPPGCPSRTGHQLWMFQAYFYLQGAAGVATRDGSQDGDQDTRANEGNNDRPDQATRA